MLTKIVKFYSSNLKLSSDSKEVNEKIIILIMNTIMNCNRKEIINDLIIFTVDQYHVIFKSNVADKQIVLESILTIIHTCVLALSKTIPTEAILKPLIEVLDAHLNAYGV